MSTTTAAKAPSVTSWSIDPAHTHVEFAVRHMMITTVKGRFGIVQGTVRIDEDHHSRSEVEITIDADYVRKMLADVVKDQDLSRYIL